MYSPGKSKADDSSSSSWLTTFGDMITLLFTFFVLVYSFCSYSPGEWETAVGSIKGALAVIPGTKGNRVIPGGGAGPFPGHLGVVPLFGHVLALEETRQRAFNRELAEIRDDVGGTEGIEIEETSTGCIFRIATPLLFDRGSADTKDSAEGLLETIAHTTRGGEAIVVVTGHTCDLPISTSQFRSNWELSARRATNVLRVIQAKAGPQTRFVALARGEHDPLVPNEDEQCRSRNRRVEIRLDFVGGFPFES
jgi:chemotaxis protein MotB